jgi:phenylalanyl-tRNA synthetase beta chain
MKISLSWLSELVDGLRADVKTLAEKLTRAGLEVETVTTLGSDLAGVVVAEVVSSRPHPKSQKLTLVTVRGGERSAELVCGAPNVPAPGGKVLWATPGTRLPDGRTITEREVAGVSSPGMLCSEVELGLGQEAGGIIVLSGDDALGLGDTVLDVAIPANRPDALGHIGVAREVVALLGGALRRPPLDAPAGTRDAASQTSVRIEDEAGCPRYTARLVEGVTVGPSPRWMRRRLEAVGLRPISNLVDVTNYVMMELGHPLHAFDADRLRGGIHVRRARAGERLTTLDGIDRALEPDDLLICDDSGPVALAGVMGGASTEVTAATTRVLLECATFDPRSIRRTSRRLSLPSEAAYRFERGVDANGVELASARAAALLARLAGGRVAPGVVDVYPRPVAPRTLALRPARARSLLGLDVSLEEITRCLRALELEVAPDGERLAVTVPTVRRDLEREVDLIEEIARVHGLDDVPATLPAALAPPAAAGAERTGERARDALAAAGLHEAQTFAFTSRARIAALRLPEGHPGARPIAVVNPMRPEQEVMRTSLLPNLLAAVAHNLSFGAESVRLFEVGHVFLRSDRELPHEPLFVAGALAGDRPGWLTPDGSLDFTDAKGAVERLGAALRVALDFVPARSEHGFLHPGVAAQVLAGGVHVGLVGEVHPDTRARLGIERPAFAFELNLELLPRPPAATLRPIPRHPAVGRDVSFFVDAHVPAARIRSVLEDGRPPILEDVRVTEDYREAGKVPAGKKGMLWSMTYRAEGRTLTDAEVDAAHEALVARLLSTLGAERR